MTMTMTVIEKKESHSLLVRHDHHPGLFPLPLSLLLAFF